MNSKEEKQALFIEWIKKWLFPDFTNKLTWCVAGTGIAIILAPDPLKLIFYNWLVNTFNLNSGLPFTLAELKSSEGDNAAGGVLVVFALIHNIANKFLIYRTEILATEKEKGQQERQEKEQQERREVDRALFQQFLDEFPSDGSSIMLLEEHDFGNSYHRKKVEQLDDFIYNWNNTQKQFLDPELESKRKQLWDNCQKFSYKLAMSSYQLCNSSMFSCIPDAYRNAWDWPSDVEKKIGELNEMAKTCFRLHSEFVRLGRNKLKC
ncbi:hypothetical protein [Xenorhabdus bovienii]|uniref:hypothetical protein n=1 Tax=Xenorhabdus bovienii TaxID=40576 RepID=UPI0023B332E0|nr:hypothetical protein [Xenorhabdus bovienii]MDE9455831.1 hypothetical protein [Xenorhabdus bovienii]